MAKTNESSEALMRIVIGIVAGFILGLWRMLIGILAVVNFFITLFTNKRNKEMADFCEIWNTQMYTFTRYMTFVSNKRPFPFEEMSKNISKFEK